MKARSCGVLFSTISILFFAFISCSNNSTQPNQPANNPPTISLISPTSAMHNLDTSITFVWSAQDKDNDTLTFTFELDTLNGPVKILTGLTAQSVQVSDLKYYTYYDWKVTVFDGKDSARDTGWIFWTKPAPIMPSTFVGFWNTQGYVGGVLTYQMTLQLNPDYSFRYQSVNVKNGLTLNYSGAYTINMTDSTLVLNNTSPIYQGTYSYEFDDSRNYLYLTNLSGFDYFNGVLGTIWSFRKQ